MTDNKRLIAFDGTVNFRDIGGYRGLNGKKTKWHKIYRSDSLSSLSDNDQKRLTQMEVTVDCDLRSSHEQLLLINFGQELRCLIVTYMPKIPKVI